jgi:hypothetical protein
MQNQPMTDLPGSLVDRVAHCMTYLHTLLLPPFGRLPVQEFASTIQEETGADAVSIFLVSREDPNRLDYAGGVGYKQQCPFYLVNGKFLTSTVHLRRLAINASRNGLDAGNYGDDIPRPSGRCERFIATARFNNIVAVPIVFGDEESYGVLKLENKKDSAGTVFTADQEFPPEDFALAKILALIIAVAYHQRRYAELWSEGEKHRRDSRSPDSYLDKVSGLLVQSLHAEAACVFLKIGKDLEYTGGFGYTTQFTQCKAVSSQRNSFISYVAQLQIPITITTQELKRSHFNDVDSKWLKEGGPRNILGIPLMDKAEYLGVLRIENKLPIPVEFDNHDEDVCKAFADEQIIPALREFAQKGKIGVPVATEGYDLLCKRYEPSKRLKGRPLVTRAKAIAKMRQDFPQITLDDITRYLQISRPYYYRLTSEKTKPSPTG